MHTNPEVLALLALGEHAADPADTEHLAACPVCREEVDSLTRLIEQGRQAPDGQTLDTPSESVWAAIQSELGFIPVTDGWPGDASRTSDGSVRAAVASAGTPIEPSSRNRGSVPPAAPTVPGAGTQPTQTAQPVQPAVDPTDRPLADRRRGRRALSLVLAAALALVAGIAIGVGVNRAGQPQETVIGRATLVAQPNWPGASGTARVVEDTSGNRVLYVDLETSQSRPGNQQVWLATPGSDQMKPMGWLNAEGQGFWTLPPGLSLTSFPVIDVTVEPADDNGLSYSGDSIVRGELQR